MSDYSAFAQANPGTDYPVKDAALRAQLTIDSDKIDAAGKGYAFGWNRGSSAALNFAYYGGQLNVAGTLTAIAASSVALTNATTNYVEMTTAGVISANTAGFTAGRIRLYTAVTAGGAITVVTDKRGEFMHGGDASIGALAVAGLLDVSGAAAGQIKFPATQNASADANTLDDYEEGTWTPTDASGAGLTFTTPAGAYEKIGRQFRASFSLTYPATASGASALIGGMPFTTANTQPARQGFVSLSTEASAQQLVTEANATTTQPRTDVAGVISNLGMSGDTIYGTVLSYV